MVTPRKFIYIYLSPSKFCSRWSCLFSNITAIWIAPVNINALQLHYIYTSSRDRNLFCKWERKYMCVWSNVAFYRTHNITHTPQQKFSFPPEILSAVLLLQMVVLHGYFFHLHSISIMIQRISRGYEMAKIIFYLRLPGAVSGLIDI